jgi:uncharacterized coiled-coil protein SlyX
MRACKGSFFFGKRVFIVEQNEKVAGMEAKVDLLLEEMRSLKTMFLIT